MSKYIKLFKDGYDPEVETLHLYENRPFIGYSEPDEKVIYTEDIPYFYVESLVEDNAAGLGQFIVESILSQGGACLKVSTDKITWIDVMTVLGQEAFEVTELGLNYPPRLYPIQIPLGIGQRLYFNLEADSICPLENFQSYYGNRNPTVGCFGPFSVGGILTTFTNGASNYTSGYNTYTYGGFFAQLPVCHAQELILPCTGLVSYSFFYMFANCTYLETYPNLQNISLAHACFQAMFQGCTSLTTAPELPATELADYCYENMFYGCTSLSTAPELPATTLAPYCYDGMFQYCTSLTVAPELPATKLAQGCYNYMFDNCTSLTTAPELPAMTLAEYCYDSMFYNCTSLNHITCLATDISASSCIYGWVEGVASTGTFIKHPDMNNWTTNSSSGIPSGWTVVDAEI